GMVCVSSKRQKRAQSNLRHRLPRFRQRLERNRKPSGVLPRRFPVALKALPKPWQTMAKIRLSAFLALAANT
ncbi:hypothetical protein ACIL7F_26825, partial [Escherichia coli]